MDLRHLPWISILGIIGNVVGVLVSIASLRTIYQIYKKKTSAGFQSIPNLSMIFSSMLWIYYALLKKNLILLLISNAVRFVTQIFCIGIYIHYASEKEKAVTVRLFLLVNVFGFGIIFVSTFFLKSPVIRLRVVGYISMPFTLLMYAAPLCIVRKLIKTKNVEYMPFPLSAFLTLAAVIWFFYGFMSKDVILAAPNTVGFFLGILQMIIYAIYRKHSNKLVEEPNLHRLSKHNTNDGADNSNKI